VINMRRRKTYLWGLLAVLLLTALAGCAQDNGGPEVPGISEPVEYTVELYFTNDAYVETGDESLDHYLTESRTIQVAEGENPWIVMLEALKTAESQGVGTVIGQDVIFDRVAVSEEDETILIVDFGSIGSGGGSMQEGFFIGQIVQTLIHNAYMFEGGGAVDKIQFLVKGEPVESLMGHFDASEPFTSEFN
jgi:germination protein M